MEIAKATVTFDSRPQVSVGGELQAFKLQDVNGKQFQGVDLGNGTFAKLKERTDGKFDVTLFRTDGGDLNQSALKVIGGTVSRMKDSEGLTFQGEGLNRLTSDPELPFSSQSAHALISDGPLPPQDVPPPLPKDPPPPLPQSVSDKGSVSLPPSDPPPPLPPTLSDTQTKVAERAFDTIGLRKGKEGTQNAFGDIQASQNKYLKAFEKGGEVEKPSDNRLIGQDGHKPEERLMRALNTSLPYSEAAFSFGGNKKLNDAAIKYLTKVGGDQPFTPKETMQRIGMLFTEIPRHLTNTANELGKKAAANDAAGFAKSADEFGTNIQGRLKELDFASELLTNPDFLKTIPSKDREAVMGYGQSLKTIANELRSLDGAVQRMAKFAEIAKTSPQEAMNAFKLEASNTEPRVPTETFTAPLDPTGPAPIKIDLDKIQNKEVREVAKKFLDRVDKIEKGVQLAQQAGLKGVGGLKVEEQLQRLFEMADAHGDDKMIDHLLDAMTFVGKLSPFETTSSDGRAATRAAQLFRALEGDGSYATIKQNISNLSFSPKDMRAMARDENLLASLDKNAYVDANKLLRVVDGQGGARQISDTHREWHLEQATLMKAFRELEGKDPATQKQLALTMLQSFAKAAPMGQDKAEEIGAQVSPLYNQSGIYHRSASTNKLLNDVLVDFCKDMNVNMGYAHLVDNATFSDVMAREFTMPGLQTKVGSEQQFEDSIKQLFDLAKQGKFPEGPVALDVTGMYKDSGLSPKDLNTKITADLEKKFLEMAETFLSENPTFSKDKLSEMMSHLQVASFVQHKGVDVLLTPRFLYRGPAAELGGANDLQNQLLEGVRTGTRGSSHTDFFDGIEHSMISGGYRLDPIQARQAWLEVTPAKDILLKSGIQITELATSEKPTPTVFTSFKAFTEHRSFSQFEALAKTDNPPPYLKVLVGATSSMLKGLTDANVDQVMKNKGLDEVLQTSYYRMLNAMGDAVHNSTDMVKFDNAIEVLQQEVATILSLVEPHKENTFGDGIRKALTSPDGPGGKPIIPPGLDPAIVQLKPSAMHCLSSILSSVEAQKGGNQLNVAVLKDHYYESSGAIETSKTYSVSAMDGDSLAGGKKLDPTSLAGNKPIDVYVCDFHHNISIGRNHYQTENLMHHVDQLFDQKLVGKALTVAIDCTIDHVKSEDMQKFLAHNKDRIASGELNVVFFRSAQKFDMFGMDNYYGGFAVSVNKNDAFPEFNSRMNAKEDQLKGISMQGLSHVGAHASSHMDEYRAALMQNTKRFYDNLPPGLIWKDGSTSAMQVAKTDDPNAVFLDIKFPGNITASEKFAERIKAFAQSEGLPLTGRASFGFATTNFNLIHGEKTRLTPGLEGPGVQDRYIAFFKATYECANQAVTDGTQKGLTGDALNQYVANQIATMPFPK